MTSLEHAAKAISLADNEGKECWDILHERTRDIYREFARAAFAALRDNVSREMMCAARTKMYSLSFDEAEEVFRAMIDAALEEKGE